MFVVVTNSKYLSSNACPFGRGLKIVRFGNFYNLPTSGILTTSVNTPSKTSQTVSDFYDVIGRMASISTLKVHPRRSPMIKDFYDECEHEICLSGTSGMIVFVFTFYQSLIFSEL